MTDYLNIEKVTADDEIGRIVEEKIVSQYCTGYILVGEDRTCIPKYFVKYAEQIKTFEVKNDDVWVATFPKAETIKTGTTWTQEMVWLIANNLDYEGAQESQLARFPFLEISAVFDEEKLRLSMKPDTKVCLNSVEVAEKQKSPRFIKTHLPFSLLPDQIKDGTKTPKIIYCMRNPKDTCVSLYHHGILLEGWTIDLESFAQVFMADRAMYGSYWKNLFGYWKHRNSLNILFIKYEDMKRDLPSVIKKVANFLGKEVTEEQIKVLAEYLSFESMRDNIAVNKQQYIDELRKNNVITLDGRFMRSGTVGQYKEELSAETIKQLDAWIRENTVGTSFEGEYSFNV